MFLSAIGYYIPEERITNSYFTNISGQPEEWYFHRTGIISRSRAKEHENIDYMSVQAVKNAAQQLPYSIEDVDLIIFASYTPNDTVGTTAHVIQREFHIPKAKVFYLSSACSSAINALEVIKSFFETGIASKALLICADHNSAYSNDNDSQAGHLWGDAATALFFAKEQFSKKEARVIDIMSQGMGHVGKGPLAVNLQPTNGGISMPHGKDVFNFACTYIAKYTTDIIEKNGYSLPDLSYFISHQANMRIVSHVCQELNIPEKKSLSNLTELGNTGCGSSLLVFAQNIDKFKKDDLICVTTFGGGYSVGSCLFSIIEN